MNLIRLFSIAYIIVLFNVMQSCEKEPALPEVRSFANVDERLWSFFEEFEQEAAERGMIFDLTTHNLRGSITDIDDEGVAGTCSYGFRSPSHVTVDLPFWENSSFLSRELVVFHELGHCVLDRDHSEELTENGFCGSIMRSGTGDCRTLYSQTNRDYYLDELFEVIRP